MMQKTAENKEIYEQICCSRIVQNWLL